MSNTGHKNISRYSGKRAGKGLQVCVQWRKRFRYRRFPFSEYGYSYAKTLIAALEWRDEMEQELGKPRTERRILSSPGVYRSKDSYGNEYWVAQCSPALGESMRKCFSIRKYGEEKAHLLALSERCEMEEKYYGGVFVGFDV